MFLWMSQELIKLGAQTPPRLGSESSTDGIEETDLDLLSASEDSFKLRPIVIDGSNVAMRYTVVFKCISFILIFHFC